MRKMWIAIAYSPAGAKLWENHYYGPLGFSNYATAIAVGANGNIHVTGYSFSDYFTFNDYATLAYSPVGQLLWERRFDGGDANGDYASAIAVGANGNVYVTGRRFRYYVLTGDPENTDYSTIAYGANGTLLWQRDFGGPAEFQDQAKGIAVNRLGNLLVTGVSQDANQRWDIATVQYDGDTGTQMAAQTIDTNNADGGSPSYVAVAPNDKLAVAGGITGVNLMDYLTHLLDNGTSNIAPIANAGVDQVLTCTSKQTSVTLDASASTAREKAWRASSNLFSSTSTSPTPFHATVCSGCSASTWR